MKKKKKIANWGNHPSVEASLTELEFVDDISRFVKAEDSLLARGNGRCYGDAALHYQLFSTLKLDKMLDFDKGKGELECQAGVLLVDILQLIVPKGFFLPVTPGTQFITLGGAIAADVHGKNHHQEGCFSQHLLYFDLMCGDGRMLRCSPSENARLFWETIGGMGLTGIIISARFRLKKIATAYLWQERIKVPNLTAVMDLFDQSQSWPYSVAWINCLASGSAFGRSILMRARHAALAELPARQLEKPLHIRPRLRLDVPFNMPGWLLNKWTIRSFNFLYCHSQRAEKKEGLIDYDRFFYPLDSIRHWNRIYGKRGFTQYQLVLPLASSRKGLEEVLSLIQRERRYPFLTVLKLFGPAHSQAINSFPMEGYTLAMDFKIDSTIQEFISKLDEIVLRYSGRVYLAKDAFSDRRLSRLQFEERDARFQSLQEKRGRH